MQILNRTQITGNNVAVKTMNEKHFTGKPKLEPNDDVVKPFADLLFKAVDKVNSHQLDANDLQHTLAINPEEVNIHEVMIATEKARLSVSFFKTIIEKAVKAYQEIMMIR